MKTTALRSFTAAACLAWVAACATVPAGQAGKSDSAAEWVEEPDSGDLVKLTIVGTNDVHGWIEPYERASGREGVSVLGGTDIFASYLKILRQKRPDGVVLLDAGDLFQGTLVANMTEGEAVIMAYNLLRYDAVAVGNHEFDYGPIGEGVIARSAAEDPIGNLKRRMGEAMFPFLAANVTEKATGNAPPWKARDTVIVERKGVRIGIIGLSTPKTPSVTLSQNVEALQFEALASSAKRSAAMLRERGANIVLVTMHAGGGCDTSTDPQDSSKCDGTGELFGMLKALPPGTIDAVVAGHTHQYLSHFVEGVPAIQSSSFGVAFGMIELWYDKKAGKVVPARTRISKPIPLCRKVFAATQDCRRDVGGPLEPARFLGEVVTPSVEVADALRPAFRLVEKRKAEQLGPVLMEGFGRARMRESELGNFVTDVMRTEVPGTKVAVTNSGGLRADLDAGPVTYGKVFSVLPFENRMVSMQLSGEQLVALLTQGVVGEHGILQVSGVRLEAVEPGTQPCPGQPRISRVTFDDGSPIVPTELYQVVTNDFVANGGDGFDKVLDAVDSDRKAMRTEMAPLREIVASYLRAHPNLIAPTRGQPRLKFYKPECAATPAP